MSSGKKKSTLCFLCHIYEAEGIGNRLFFLYLKKYMECGNVFEIYHVPNQHALKKYIEKLNPEFVEVNTGSHTYKDTHGQYQLKSSNWVEELSHRIYLTPYGITRFVKY